MFIGSIYRVIAGFKIRSKADVKTFMEDVLYKDGEWYIKQAKDQAMIINKHNGLVRVSFKYGDLSDIFNPEFESCDVYETLWKNRKHINNYFFNPDN